MHISFDCATQRHDRCNGLRIVGRTAQVAVCECLCHGHTTETQLRAAARLLTGQEA